MKSNHPSRRTIVASAAAVAAVTGLQGPMALVAPASAKAPAADRTFHKLKIGDATLTTVYDGIFEKPHNESFIKDVTVEQTKAALEKGGRRSDVVPITFTIPVLQTGGKTVMFDAGTGGQLSPKAGLMTDNLKAAGIDPASIDTIVLTHFHPDHIFGLMEKGTNAQIFPNAEIVVPAAELAYWTDDAEVAKLPERRQGLAKRIQATLPTWKNVRQIADGEEPVSGVTAMAAYGHTAGHTVYRVASGSDAALIVADTANVPALFVANPDWQVQFDADGAMAAETRKRVFDMAVADNLIVTGYHFGFPGAGRIERDGKGFAFVPAA
jgi:glyoxylase-like metal-dependent hydrolase (beta-lactamase superfamily II)